MRQRSTGVPHDTQDRFLLADPERLSQLGSEAWLFSDLVREFLQGPAVDRAAELGVVQP